MRAGSESVAENQQLRGAVCVWEWQLQGRGRLSRGASGGPDWQQVVLLEPAGRGHLRAWLLQAPHTNERPALDN
jgi:hypothetical protein